MLIYHSFEKLISQKFVTIVFLDALYILNFNKVGGKNWWSFH